MTVSAQLEVGNADLGVPLPMSGLAAVVLAPLELEHVDLGGLGLAHHLRRNRGASDERGSRPDGLTVGGEQYLVEGDLGAGRGVHQRYPQGLALFRPELLAEGPKDRV